MAGCFDAAVLLRVLFFSLFFGLQLACWSAPLRGVLPCSIRCGLEPEIVACCLNLLLLVSYSRRTKILLVFKSVSLAGV